MAKKNNKENRLTFDFSEFFVEKVKFENNKIFFGSNNRIEDIAKLLNKDVKAIEKKTKLAFTGNQILDDDQIAEIAMAFGFEFEKVDDVSEENVLSKIDELVSTKEWAVEALIQEKPPIITIMGHVDHGKTTLLDKIRKSNLTAKEAGGITQTIGAYQIEYKGKPLTFIDTPGHEAFTEMRANGSQITDISIIVVAADDALMPQTKESIDHSRAAGVPMIVAINKIDAPGANVENVMNKLAEYDLMPEIWGGVTPVVEISALNGTNIDGLIETILLQAEMMELRVPANVNATGVVIESNIDKQRGNLVSVIVKNGELRVGDLIVIDDIVTKVKAMKDDMGRPVTVAGPSKPVELFGIGAAPVVGSRFAVVSNEAEAKKIAKTINEAKLNAQRKLADVSVDDLFAQLSNKQKKQLNLILKTDSLGSVEAISAQIENLVSEDVEVNLIRKSIGEVTNTDIQLAAASAADILAFNVSTPKQLETLIREKRVRIFEYDIIYKLLEDLEARLSGMEETKYEENKLGSAEVQQIFSFSKVGNIAGIIVRDGLLKPGLVAKVMRKGKLIAEDKIDSLKTGKDSTKQRAKGQEGGITLVKFDEFEVGDIIEAFEMVKV